MWEFKSGKRITDNTQKERLSALLFDRFWDCGKKWRGTQENAGDQGKTRK